MAPNNLSSVMTLWYTVASSWQNILVVYVYFRQTCAMTAIIHDACFRTKNIFESIDRTRLPERSLYLTGSLNNTINRCTHNFNWNVYTVVRGFTNPIWRRETEERNTYGVSASPMVLGLPFYYLLFTTYSIESGGNEKRLFPTYYLQSFLGQKVRQSFSRN